MGHYDDCYEVEKRKARERWEKRYGAVKRRRAALVKKLKEMPLAAFLVKELGVLLRVTGPDDMNRQEPENWNSDLDVVEKALERINKAFQRINRAK